MDNCTRENKNRYFLSYVQALVHWNVFKEVEVSFLPVGHTHEDIDQAFSTTSSRLRNHNAITLVDIQNELRQVYNSHTQVGHMRHIINWSGLCENEKVLTALKNFTTYRFFHFFSGTSNQGGDHNTSVRCRVKVSVYDEWKELDYSFLSTVPDLSKTPPTIFDLSSEHWNEQKIEVTKRINSEEVRIRNPAKLAELRQLRDSVFRSRKEGFHWNLKESIELRFKGNGPVTNGKNSNLVEDIHQDTNELMRGEISTTMPDHETSHSTEDKVEEESTRNDRLDYEEASESILKSGYDYEISSFVAVLSDNMSGPNSFWIGKVVEARSNRHGVVQKICVHWYQPYSRNGNNIDNFHDMYAPSYIDQRTTKERPWKGDVDTSAVIVNFDSLLRNRRLPAAVQKHLRVSLPSR